MKDKKLKILFIAPIKKGGPYLSLKKLSNYYNRNDILNAEFTSSFKGFLKGIFSRKYDIIHTVLPVPFNIWRTPILLNIRGNYKKERNFRNPLGYLYPISIYFSSKILTPSKYMMKELNILKFELIPNSIDKSKFIETKTNFSLKKNSLKLVILTSFKFYEKGSGVLNLINIINKLDSRIKIELKIIGSGKYLDLIKSKIKVNKNIQLIWKGNLNNPYPEIISSDIFTYYSNLDNYPNAILEAITLKIPIISNNIGAVSEFLPKENIGFDDDDYFKKLNDIISNYNEPKTIKVLSFLEMTKLYLKVYNQVYKK